MKDEDFPVLKISDLILNNFNINDAKDIYELRSDDEVMKYMDTDKLETVEDAKKFIEKVLESYHEDKGFHWAIRKTDDGEMMGYITIWRIDYKNYIGEIGYSLKRKYWKKGIISTVFPKIIEYAFSELGLNRIEANLNPDNKNSEKLLERMNFKREGIFRENYFYNGVFLDTLTYSRLKRD